VPVHDLKIHPRERELIAGTHGRSIWIVDIAPLQQLTPQIVAQDAVLFEPSPGLQYGYQSVGGESTGQMVWEASVPQYGAELTYYIGSSDIAAAARSGGGQGQGGGRGGAPTARIVIMDASGDTVQSLTGPLAIGVHRVTWNFRGDAPPRAPLSPSERRDSIVEARRLQVVADSLIAAGADRAAVERVAEQLRSGPGFGGRGGRGGGGGGFGGGRGGWADRPGETPPTEPRRGGRGGGFGGGPDAELMRDMVRLVRGGQGGFGGGGFGGGAAAPLADPGTYTVSLVLPGRTLTTRLTVIRAGGYPSGILPPGAESAEEFDEEEWQARAIRR
jgi:hypothetical protein